MAKRGESMQKTEYEIPSPANCTIALVTDLHEYDPEPVLEILHEAKPDVIAVAGDTMERHHRGENLDNQSAEIGGILFGGLTSKQVRDALDFIFPVMG